MKILNYKILPMSCTIGHGLPPSSPKPLSSSQRASLEDRGTMLITMKALDDWWEGDSGYEGAVFELEEGLGNLLIIAILVSAESDEEVTTTPSPITTSSSPSAPNAPSKTTSTKETTSSHENTSSSFQSKLQLSPTPSNEPTSPQTQNPFLQNLMDVPPRPSNPQPIQTISPLDITLSLSPITPLEIPSSPPLPQPPIMGHPLYYNYHDYHGSTCVCCFNNRNLYLNLRDEMNIMFAHLEYLITTALTTHFPPPP
ncbi:hypothetical protein Tco_1188707 [Tanacetum coccineum]